MSKKTVFQKGEVSASSLLAAAACRASSRRAKGRVLLEALERPGSSQLLDLLKLAEANVPIPPAHDQGILSTPRGKMYVPESPLYLLPKAMDISSICYIAGVKLNPMHAPIS